jgi:hypothetical protein
MTNYTFDQLLDFTRTTSGTFVGSNGLIQTTPASVNLFTQTQQFDNAAWTKEATTATANVTTAPDGTSTADKIAATATTVFHNVRQAVTQTVATYTYSVYAKASEYSKLILANATSGTWSATFDLATGATIATGGTAVLSSSIQSVGNGWYRCAVTFTGAAVDTAHSATGYPNTGVTLNNFGASYTGDGTSGVFLWGAQLQTGSTATDYTRNNGGVYPARFDYDPATLQPKGILIEEQRTNLVLQTSDFTAASWAAAVSGTSTRTNNGTALGFMSATVTATSADGGIRQVLTGLTAAQVYTLSFYIQSAATSVRVRLENSISTYGAFITVIINPSNGTASAPSGFTSVTATPFGAGYLYKLTLPAAGGTLIANLEWAITASGGTMQLGMPQFEAGAFATSYIPTVASQVTRAADQCSIVAPLFAPWYAQPQGTFVIDASTFSNGSPVALAVSSTGTDYMFIRRGAGAPSFRIQTTVGVVQGDFGTIAATGKTAAAYRVNDFAVSSNGGAAATDTAGDVPSVNKLDIGSFGGGLFLNGHIRSVQFYPVRLADFQLQALTA